MIENDKYIAIPPGMTIMEILEDRQIHISDFAILMNMSIYEINELLIGKLHITNTIATKLEETLCIPFEFWIKLEHQYLQKISLINN